MTKKIEIVQENQDEHNAGRMGAGVMLWMTGKDCDLESAAS